MKLLATRCYDGAWLDVFKRESGRYMEEKPIKVPSDEDSIQPLGLRSSLSLHIRYMGMAIGYRYLVVCVFPTASGGPLRDTGSWINRPDPA